MRISNKQRGFTLIELLVVITIIGILAAMALPNFIKMRAKANEAEVKAGIHAIQVALERYAVDSGGVYPSALSGADYPSNCFMRENMYSASGQYVYNLGTIGSSSFHNAPWERSWEGAARSNSLRWKCDPLIQYGYLGQFPPNPFQKKSNGMWSGQQDYDPDNPNFQQGPYGYQFNVGAFGCGGRYGNLMWDVAWGLGSVPNIDFIGKSVDTNDEGNEVEQIDNDVEGNFYYHPLFADNRAVAEPGLQPQWLLHCKRLLLHELRWRLRRPQLLQRLSRQRVGSPGRRRQSAEAQGRMGPPARYRRHQRPGRYSGLLRHRRFLVR